MKDQTKNDPQAPKPSRMQRDDAMVKNSALYKEFLAQREAILNHKWAKSQQCGEEIGFETALYDWMLHHRRNWKSTKQSAAGSR